MFVNGMFGCGTFLAPVRRAVFLAVAVILDGSVAGIRDQFLESCELLLGNIAVGAGLQPAEGNVHDADSGK